MRVLRADDTRELELSGTPAELRRLAEALRSGQGRWRLDTAGDPAPYSRALASLEAVRTAGLLVVSADLASLRLAGDRAYCTALASVLTGFAEEGDLSGHLHLEHLPGHAYLSPCSEPLVIALAAG
jgi:hypothetical protein